MKEPRNLNANPKTPRRQRSTISWQNVPADVIKDFVTACEAVGVGVVLGRTLAGSALSVVCLAGDEKPRDYINTPDDIVPVLEGLLWAIDADVPTSLQMADAGF